MLLVTLLDTMTEIVSFCYRVTACWHLDVPSSGVCWWLNKGWGPVDVFSTGWWQEGHPTSKSLHQLPLMECTFPPLLFLHRRPLSCLRRTWWDGVTTRAATRRTTSNVNMWVGHWPGVCVVATESVGSVTNWCQSTDRREELRVVGLVSPTEDVCWLQTMCCPECRLPALSGTLLSVIAAHE